MCEYRVTMPGEPLLDCIIKASNADVAKLKMAKMGREAGYNVDITQFEAVIHTSDKGDSHE